MAVSVSALSSEVPALHPGRGTYTQHSKQKVKYEADVTVLRAAVLTLEEKTDRVSTALDDPSKALTIAAKKISEKIEELLNEKLPEGLKSLKPEDVTPEATASRIVSGTTAYFDVYAKQHPEIKGEELLSAFIDAIKGGIQTGYDDAYQTLEGLGAFSFEGVREGVEKTRSLIDEKLAAWEDQKRKELGLDAAANVEDVQAQ